MIIKLVLLFFLWLFIAPESQAFLVYSYDSEGIRIYYRLNPADYQKNKSRKYAHIYETQGPRSRHYYSKEERDKYYINIEQNRKRYR